MLSPVPRLGELPRLLPRTGVNAKKSQSDEDRRIPKAPCHSPLSIPPEVRTMTVSLSIPEVRPAHSERPAETPGGPPAAGWQARLLGRGAVTKRGLTANGGDGPGGGVLPPPHP